MNRSHGNATDSEPLAVERGMIGLERRILAIVVGRRETDQSRAGARGEPCRER
jgi:hypothetical protein